VQIAIGSDHRGLELKRAIIRLLDEKGYAYEDFGAYNEKSVDYPDIAVKVAKRVAEGDFEFGILICGTGIGMCIAANKVNGIRAALCHNVKSAQRARQHNNANILCLAGEEEHRQLNEIIDTFLTAEFEGGRHQRRLDKIKDIEAESRQELP
jgi:ribose 5-phosphate isomerase B